MTSPTQRTLAECRRRGWIADVTERWITVPNHPAGGKRKDLFGFVDVVAIGDRTDVEEYRHRTFAESLADDRSRTFVAIQATSGSNGAARVKKIQNECSEALEAWLAAGGIVEVWAWKRYAKPVDRKYWRPRIVRVESTE